MLSVFAVVNSVKYAKHFCYQLYTIQFTRFNSGKKSKGFWVIVQVKWNGVRKICVFLENDTR